MVGRDGDDSGAEMGRGDMRHTNRALEHSGRRQGKFQLQFVSDRGRAAGLNQHPLVRQVEHFARTRLCALDKTTDASDRKSEESPFVFNADAPSMEVNTISICGK
jgi:hypothetical protein